MATRKQKQAHRSTIWRRKNPDKVRDSQLKCRYGISTAQYEDMLKNQNHRCAICGTDKPNGHSKRFFVDHCHDTQVVRGLLCSKCNLFIGLADHNQDILLEAINYLKQ